MARVITSELLNAPKALRKTIFNLSVLSDLNPCLIAFTEPLIAGRTFLRPSDSGGPARHGSGSGRGSTSTGREVRGISRRGIPAARRYLGGTLRRKYHPNGHYKWHIQQY